MSTSLFRRVTRYPISWSHNAGENRLTEITAAVLEHVAGFDHAFTRELLRRGAEEDLERRGLSADEAERRRKLCKVAEEMLVRPVEVNTQVPTGQGFIDLELLFRPGLGEARPGLLLWVEIKHGAPLSGDQLDRYLEDIRTCLPSEDVWPVIVLLAPRGWARGEENAVPTEVLWVEWQDIAKKIKALCESARPPAQAWLLSEYVRYLKEEGLSEPDALTESTALALMNARDADAAATGLCEYADQWVRDEWGGQTERPDVIPQRETYGKARFGKDYYANHNPCRTGHQPDPNWQNAWFEWGLRRAADMDGLGDIRGTWVFMAGVTPGEGFTAAPEDGKWRVWWAGLAKNGFRRFRLDDRERLAVLRYPDELLAETTLEAQGNELGRWIVDTFESLCPPPPV